MLNKKRAFVSLGAGIFIFVVGFLGVLLMLRLLNSPHGMYTVLLWILIWPTRLIGCFFTIRYPGGGAVTLPLTIGPIADIAILSGLIYSALTLFRKKSPSLSPLPPPAFKGK
jgi:hypothetical protein